MPRAQSWVGFIGVLATAIGLLYQPVYQRLVVVGAFRPEDSLGNIHGVEALKVIPNTAICEDLHHHRFSNQLYAACQDDEVQRLNWFPALANFKNPKDLNTGSITLIDPDTFTSKKLRLKGFKGPLVTHGIDILSPRDDPNTVYIYAVNHLPNPEHYDASSAETASREKARSQIELFKHSVGSDEAEFIRTIRHPLIRTPNDIYATELDAFYVTNDHYYRDGPLRTAEDLLTTRTAPWTDTVHVKINDMKSKDSQAGIIVTQALTGMHNNNGLGHGHPDNPSEVLLADASGGVLHRARRSLEANADPTLQRLDSFQLMSTLDNPSYFVDEYATKSNNASGYVLPGMAKAMSLASDYEKPDRPIPVMVWHLRTDTKPTNQTMGGWTPHLVYQDAGYTLRSASGAVIVGIDPDANGSKKQGWLFVTGFVSRAIVAAKINL